jgi:tetratricopeptide (TPR) repeat protein
MQIGNIDFERGRLEAALDGYLAALVFATQTDTMDLEARASNNVALVHSTMGQKTEAIRMFSRSLQLFRKLKREDAVARTEHNIGMTYLDLRNWREARNHFSRSIEISSRIGLDEMLAVSRLELAETNLRLGRVEEAGPDIARAMTLCHQRNDPLGMATAYRLQGMMAALEGDLGSAEEHLESSITILRDLGQTPHLGLALLERGRVHLEAGDTGAARPALEEARHIFESLETPHEALEEIQTLWERCLKKSQ